MIIDTDVLVWHLRRNENARAIIHDNIPFRHGNSMELADALIAATCTNNAEILLTANDKHYKFVPNIQIKRFIP